ncbi:MAG: DUF3772 domain-containing protein [Rhizobiaceae bacterium]|nr:DUF3772 domain-containing protein [Rhizobiaceae bacterium]
MPLRLCSIIISVFYLLLFSTAINGQEIPTNHNIKADTAVESSKSPGVTIQDKLANWRGTLLSTEQALSRSGLSDSELAERSAETTSLRLTVIKLEQELAPSARLIKEQLDELGPAPQEGAPAETAEIAGKRKELEEQFSQIDGELKAARLIAVRAAQIEHQIVNTRRDRFIFQISRQSTSVFNFQLWTDFLNGLEGMGNRFSLLMGESFSAMKTNIGKSNLLAPMLWGITLLVAFILFTVRYLFRRKFNTLIASSGSDVFDHYIKVRLAAISFIRNGLVPAGIVLLVYFLLSAADIFTRRLEIFASQLAVTFAALIVAFSLAYVFLNPQNSSRRLANLSDDTALKINRVILFSIVLIAFFRLASSTAVILVTPFEVTIALSALMAIVCFIGLFLVLIITASNTTTMTMQVPPRRNLVRWGFINPLFWFTGIGGVIALVIGYIAFAQFLAWQILIAAMLFALLWLTIELLDLHRDRYLDADSGRWRQLSRATGFSRQTVLQGSVFGFGIAKLAVISAAAMIFMISWGYRTGDWAGPIGEAFFGFKIGGLSISLSSIALAILLFIVGFFVTQAIRYWLSNQFLPTTTLDPGLQNSIATIFGYSGYVMAALMAITAAGLDLSKVAIVAGALSVGIGFGLQSIVNNFVSGLILLAERPIKAGDWIITGGGEGTVRRTSVRSTEIETFDGATVIIPNSTLITDAVTNWTHRDQKGRIKIPIGVGYDSDPEKVREILLECGRAHERIATSPAPVVFFMDFGTDALLFELRVFLKDINYFTSAKSDLRFAIIKALREAKIEIPYPQRDIHIKTSPAEIAEVKNTSKKPRKRKSAVTASKQG